MQTFSPWGEVMWEIKTFYETYNVHMATNIFRMDENWRIWCCAENKWPLSIWHKNLPIKQEYPTGCNGVKFDHTEHNLDRLILGAVGNQPIMVVTLKDRKGKITFRIKMIILRLLYRYMPSIWEYMGVLWEPKISCKIHWSI